MPKAAVLAYAKDSICKQSKGSVRVSSYRSDRQQVSRVLTITLIFNLTVAAGKIGVGLLTGALAITADGFHSLVDGSANVVGLVAARLAMQPPDEDHPYGHRRYETLGALLIGAFLMLVAWEVIGGALARLREGAAPDLTPLAFAVLVGTLFVNLGVNRYQVRQGRRLRSELLLADAANTGADVFVTLAVLLSMIGITLTGWWWLDAAAALIVVLLIGRAAWRILMDTGAVLVDTAPFPAEHLRQHLHDLPHALGVARARSRGPADAAHIDIDLCVPPAMTAEQTAAITEAVRQRLSAALPGVSEIEVHFLPQTSAPRDPALEARACADALGLTTHEVIVIEAADGGRVLELHVEVPPGQTLDAAHDVVTRLEIDLHARLPAIGSIVTHIEPAAVHEQTCVPLAAADRATLTRAALALLRRRFPNVGWHDLRVHALPDGLTLTLHAGLPPQTRVTQAHAIAESAETLLRAEMPGFDRVTIHTEPFDAA